MQNESPPSSPFTSDVDEFLALLLASRLATLYEIRTACSDAPRSNDGKLEIDTLCTYLVQKGLITQWQCDKLRDGKFKGFFLEGFCLLEQLTSDDAEREFAAVEMKTRKKVVLAVQRPNPQVQVQVRVVRALEE